MNNSCLNCGKTVMDRHKRTVYCSRACFSAHKQADPVMWRACITCGKRFRVRTEKSKVLRCSRSCHRGYKKTKPHANKKPTVMCPCSLCGTEFEHCPTGWRRERAYCSTKCGGIAQGLARRTRPRHAKTAHRLKIGKCERCGWDKEIFVLHVHHKDHNRENDSLDNWEVLCPTCHRYHHYQQKHRRVYDRDVFGRPKKRASV